MRHRDVAFRFSTPAPISRQRRASEPGAIFSRVAEPEVDVQVMLEGEWHRRALGESTGHTIESGCQLEGDVRFTPKRADSTEGRLCTRGCYTAFDLRRASEIAEHKAAQAARADAEHDAKWLEDENRRRTSRGQKPLLETPTQRMKRLGAMTEEEFRAAIAAENTDDRATDVGMEPIANPNEEQKP